MPSGEALLIVALSGRALARSARSAGYRPFVLDRFGDLDTQEHAEASEVVGAGRDGPFARRRLLAAAARLAPQGTPLIWGGGLDGAPGLLAAIARGRELLGNRPEQVRRITDPFAFAASCDELGIPHPAVRPDLPDLRNGWLVKRQGASGGWHVRDATAVSALAPGDYLQRRVEGRAVSVLLLGDGRRAIALALSEQWQELGRFTGVLLPAAVEGSVAASLRAAAVAMAEAHGLRGLASADFLVDGDGSFHLLEINARPGASLEAAEMALGLPLIGLHVAACRGTLPRLSPPLRAGAAATAIVWAERDLRVPATHAWPGWAGDRTPPGQRVRRGMPLATVRAQAADAGCVLALLRARRHALIGSMAPHSPTS